MEDDDPESVNTDMERPRVGTEIRVLYRHWFFLNSNVPACRIQRIPGMQQSWRAVDPSDQRGLIVFVHGEIEVKPSCIIVITKVQRTVALARELKPPI
jgi:hypothetical protein